MEDKIMLSSACLVGGETSSFGPVVLVFPPNWGNESPYPALPMLTGFLRHHGIEVIQRDFNVEWENEFLTKQHLLKVGEILRQRLSNADVGGDEREHFANTYMSIPFLAEHIAGAKKDLERSHGSIAAFNRAGRVLTAATSVCWSPYYPTYAKDSSYNSRYDLSRLGPVLEAAQSRNDNPFVAWFEQKMAALLSGRNACLVGISLTGEGQMVPAFTLAKVVKSLEPEIPVIFGGALLSYMRSALLTRREAFEWVDYYVVGEGETSLLNLCRYLEGKAELTEAPNLIYLDRGADVIRFTTDYVEKGNDWLLPDLEGLPLDTYRAGDTVWIQASRGCCWDRCAFCSLCLSMSNTYRVRDMDLVLDDIEYLIRKQNLRIIKFADECFTVDRIRQLVDGLEARGLAGAFKYFFSLRFDELPTRDLLERAYRSGLRYISWGLESAHPHTLKLMRKGIRPHKAELCLRESHACGIWNMVFVIVAFPGAPEDDLERTIDFLLANQEYIDFANLTPFQLDTGSDVYKHPDRYGVQIAARAEDYIFPRNGYYDQNRKQMIGRNPDMPLSAMRLYLETVHKTHVSSLQRAYLSPEAIISMVDGGLEGKLRLRQAICQEAEQQDLLQKNAERIASTILRVSEHVQLHVSDASVGFGQRAALYNDRTGMCSVVNPGVMQILRCVGGGKSFTQLLDEMAALAGGVDRRRVEADVSEACQELLANGHLVAEWA